MSKVRNTVNNTAFEPTNENRKRIFDAVRETPHTTLSTLSDQTGMSRSLIQFHARVLAQKGLITHEKPNGKRYYYPSYPHQSKQERRQQQLLNNERPRTIFDSLAEEPKTISELATETDLTKQGVHYHIDRLEETDLATRDRSGPQMIVRLSE